METKSFGVFGGGTEADGNATLIPFMCVWLKLTIMKLARRKNMMSIKGMISIRACFFGMGEATRIKLVGRSGHCVGNRHFYFRRAFARGELPPSKCAHCRVVENGTADRLGHRRVGHVAAGSIDTQ